MEEQSDTPRTEMAEGQRLNPYFEGRFDGESDELCALRLTLARERDEARAEVERLRSAFVHCHVRGSSGDLCAVCGLDLRDKVHTAATEAKP